MFLADTNIFLEILLGQEKEKVCREFIVKNINDLCISDFSLYSIGITLFKTKQPEVFGDFTAEVLPSLPVMTLKPEMYREIIRLNKKKRLDFDDASQTALAKNHGFKIVTLDKDFRKVQGEIEVEFL